MSHSLSGNTLSNAKQFSHHSIQGHYHSLQEVERSESNGTFESACNEHECEVWWVAYKNGVSRKPWKSMVIWGAQGRHSIDDLGYECESTTSNR